MVWARCMHCLDSGYCFGPAAVLAWARVSAKAQHCDDQTLLVFDCTITGIYVWDDVDAALSHVILHGERSLPWNFMASSPMTLHSECKQRYLQLPPGKMVLTSLYAMLYCVEIKPGLQLHGWQPHDIALGIQAAVLAKPATMLHDHSACVQLSASTSHRAWTIKGN